MELIVSNGKLYAWTGKELSKYITSTLTPGIYTLHWNYRGGLVLTSAGEEITGENLGTVGWGLLKELVKVGENQESPVILHIR